MTHTAIRLADDWMQARPFTQPDTLFIALMAMGLVDTFKLFHSNDIYNLKDSEIYSIIIETIAVDTKFYD